MTETTKTNEELEQTTIEETAPEAVETEEVVVDEKEAKIQELTAKLADEEARYVRLRADYDNLLRRGRLDREAA
ncbi:MAG: nucleotide exchange factor GrpE, partial [Solibacillus sp.]